MKTRTPANAGNNLCGILAQNLDEKIFSGHKLKRFMVLLFKAVLCDSFSRCFGRELRR